MLQMFKRVSKLFDSTCRRVGSFGLYIRSRTFNPGAYPSLKRFFHWSNSNAVIFFLWGLVIGFVGIALSNGGDYFFLCAYVSSVCAYLWSLGTWVTSDTFDKTRRLSSRERRGLESAPILRKWAGLFGVAGITLLFLLSCWITYSVRERKSLESLAGRLYPSDDPTPPNACVTPISPKSVLLVIGENAVVVDTFPHSVVSVRGKDYLSIDRDADGIISLSLDIKGPDGRLIVRMNREGFAVNANNYLQMKRPDKSTLQVTDQYGDLVVDAKYSNRQSFILNGSVRLDPRSEPVPFGIPGIRHSCLSGTPGYFVYIN